MKQLLAHLSAPSFLGVALAFILLGATAAPGRAESQVTGQSPTSYAPITNADQELQNFQRLQYLRNTGQLSAVEYQRQVMGLAANNKAGMGINALPAPVIDLIEPPRPPQVTPPPALIPVVPPTQAATPSPSTAVPSPSRPARRPNPMAQIQRPVSGPILAVQLKDVSDF